MNADPRHDWQFNRDLLVWHHRIYRGFLYWTTSGCWRLSLEGHRPMEAMGADIVTAMRAAQPLLEDHAPLRSRP